MRRMMLTAAMLLACGVAFVGCKERPAEPVEVPPSANPSTVEEIEAQNEEAAENVRRLDEEAREAADDASNKLEDAARDAQRNVGEGIEDAGEALEGLGQDMQD